MFLISKTGLLKNSDEPTIILTKAGFSPAGMKVKVGTKVKFVNKTKLSFWPASDLHPNHTIYPEFDPKRALSPKETWEFQFNQTGTFRFHDHLSPVNRGTIVVVKEVEELVNKKLTPELLLSECGKKEDIYEKTACFNDYLGDILLKKGPDAAFLMVNKLREEDPDFASECHTVAHELGGIAYWKYAKDKKFPKTGAVAYCGFGYIHGFMTEFGHHSRDFLEGAKTACNYFSEKLDYEGFEKMLNPFDQCYHGVGHGLAFFYVPDFGENISEVIKRGAKDCKEFTEDPEAVSNCTYGLFGGVASVYVGGHGFTLALDEKDPLSLCQNQPDELKGACYDSMVPTLGVLFPGITKLSSFFLNIDESFLQQTFYSLGDLSSRWRAQGKITNDDILRDCGKLSGVRRSACFEGFSQGLIRNSFPEEAPVAAFAFCRSTVLTDLEKEACYKGVILEVKNVFPNSYQETLSKLTDKERKIVTENEN